MKDSEKAVLTGKVIAQDGIAVIVNKDSKVNNLTSEQIKKIYLGEIKDWSEITD
ncbi:MAG: substrate-binding domain-containing protein [Eubacteriales bacterium]|nr:substrate-binding domain-containing protein [Eubacteriales bacterium]